MKQKDIIATSTVYFVFVAVACVIARIASNICVKLCDLFVELSFISASGVRAVTLFAFSAFFIAFFSYKYGYKIAEFDSCEDLVSSALSSLVHLVLSAVLSFSPWIAGATKHVSGFVKYGDRYTSVEHMSKIPFGTLLIVGLVNAVVFAALIYVFKIVGVKKRLSDRAKLTD